jgi:hypothetical protein
LAEEEGGLVVALGLVEQADLVVHPAEFCRLATGAEAGDDRFGVGRQVTQQRPVADVGARISTEGFVDPIQRSAGSASVVAVVSLVEKDGLEEAMAGELVG